MSEPTKVIRRGDPGAEDVAWDYAEFWTHRPDTGKPVSYAESIAPDRDFTVIVYIHVHYSDRPMEIIKLHSFYRPKSKTP
jgi:hypothetical protein